MTLKEVSQKVDALDKEIQKKRQILSALYEEQQAIEKEIENLGRELEDWIAKENAMTGNAHPF